MSAQSQSDANASPRPFGCTFGFYTQKEWPDRRSL